VQLIAAASRLFDGCFFHFFGFCGFFEIFVIRRTGFVWLAHVLITPMGNALLLGVNVGVKTGLFCSHH